MPNLNVPPIPPPSPDIGQLASVANALKMGVESLSGQRGAPFNRAVTFNDLVALGLVQVHGQTVSNGAGPANSITP